MRLHAANWLKDVVYRLEGPVTQGAHYCICSRAHQYTLCPFPVSYSNHTIQIRCVDNRVPGGPRLDDLFVTTVKTFWQVRLSPLTQRVTLCSVAHATC